MTTFLNKEEQRIFKGQMKASPTAYSLYVKEMHAQLRDKYDNAKIFREIANRWKLLDQKKKKHYTDAAEIVR